MLESPIHAHHLLRYSVELHDKHTAEAEKTAVVSFYDENNKRVSTFRFSVIPLEDIYKWIDEEKPIQLNGAYLYDFSVKEYRKSRGIKDHVPIKFHDFTARKTFFDCDAYTDFSHVNFIGEQTNFESCIFGNGFVNFHNCDFGAGEVNFKKAKFGSGSTTFQSSTFGEGTVSFFNTNFGSGNLSFIDTNFGSSHVDFRKTYFGDGTVDFKFAKFANGEVAFQKASFGKGKKDFKNVEFGDGKIDFRGIDFNDGDVSFEGVEFGKGRLNFRNSKFGNGFKNFELCDFGEGDALFDDVNFGTGTVNFNRSKTQRISFSSCHMDCFMDLRFAHCTSLDLSNTVVRDVVDLIPINDEVLIKEIKMVDMRILGRVFINWRENALKELIYVQKSTSLFQKAEQFRILKENFRNNGQYEDEDSAYLEFKRCEAKARFHNSLSKNFSVVIKEVPSYFLKKLLFDKVGHYATNPVRVLLNAIIIVFIFGTTYYFSTNYFSELGRVSSTLPDDINRATEFWNSQYYSAITFFTIGYGDYFALGYLKILAALEGFIGVFIMSYFTVAFVRKILR